MKARCLVGAYAYAGHVVTYGEEFELDLATCERLERTGGVWRHALELDWLDAIASSNAREARRWIALCDDAVDIATLTDCEKRPSVMEALNARLNELDPFPSELDP